jgi:DNA repair protein RadC
MDEEHGHRERLRARFSKTGPDGLADYELLELLLFGVLKRGDTKPAAKALLARFGGLDGVLGANAAALEKVEGCGPAVAAHLKTVHAVMGRALLTETQRRPVVSSWSTLLNYVRVRLAQEPREHFRVLFLDRKNQVMVDEALGEGTVDQAPAYPREIVRRALELSASGIILVHNHPSGDPTPSAQDIELTRAVVAAAKALGVAVHDHLVVSRTGTVSFKAQGLL